MARMANALRLLPSRRPLSIILVVFAAIMVVLVGLALWNPWRLTILYPLGHQNVAIGVLTLAGAFLAATAVFMFADNGRKALIALVACLVAVPAFCVGLPALALAGVFKEAPVNGTLTMAASPGGRYVVVKSTFDTAAGRVFDLHALVPVLRRRTVRPVDKVAGEVTRPVRGFPSAPRDVLHRRIRRKAAHDAFDVADVHAPDVLL